MAVTIHSIPADYSPSDNPLTYTFSSDKYGEENFSFIVETYIDSIKVATDRIFPEIVNGYGKFDISQIVKTRVYKPERATLLAQRVELPAVKIKVIENYGANPVNQGNATSDESIIFKAKLPSRQWEEVDIELDYVNKKWLTNVPNNTIFATRNQDVYLAMLTVGDGDSINISLHDENGTFIDLYTESHSYRLWNCNLSYSNLSSELPMDSGKYVEVVILDKDDNESEKIKIVYIDEDCIQNNVVSWLNCYGAFDQFVFTHNNMLSTKVESFSYEKHYGKWDGTKYIYNRNDAGRIDTRKDIERTGVLISGWIEDVYQNWLHELVSSIDIMLNSVKINVTTSSITFKQGRFEELINQEIAYLIDKETSIL